LTDTFRWLFVESVPLLFEKRRVARQLQIEVWLDPSPILKMLKIENVGGRKGERPTLDYIV
jgi:hypothetical protein